MTSGYKIVITKNEFKALTREMQDRVVVGVELWGMGVESQGKKTSKVDTGRLKSSYGHWTPDLVKENNEASAGDSIWNLKVTGAYVQLDIGSNVVYAISIEARFHTLYNALVDTEGMGRDAIAESMRKGFGIL